ncbi:hypothetical protein KI387_037746, partial [Taxus chinensis]
ITKSISQMSGFVLLGKFLDMGAWAVDLALSVGIFPYVLKLLQTTATELRRILVFIWTKILALDKVRASAVYALGTLLDAGTESLRDGYAYDDDDEDERSKAEQEIAKHLLKVLSDGSPLVRAELAI